MHGDSWDGWGVGLACGKEPCTLSALAGMDFGGKGWEDRGHTGISQALPPWASNGKELLRSEVCLPSSS